MSNTPEVPAGPPAGRAFVASTTPSPPGVARCSACGHTIDTWDTFCRFCGKRQAPKPAWYYEPVWILILGFVAVGPFALPLVWLSPKMNRPTKWLFTLVLGIYSVVVVYSLWVLCVMMWKLYSQLSQDLQIY